MEMEERMNLRSGLIGSVITVLLMLALSAWAWVMIPAGRMLPTHWNLYGQPDGYSGKPLALLLLPLMAVGEACLFALIARVEPRRRNIRLSIKALNSIWLASLGLLLVTHLFIVLYALGLRMDIGTIMPIALGILFIVVGNYMGKLRSNFFAGVRTPWTLSSELSWNRSNRLGGRLFILAGAITALSVLMPNRSIWAWLMEAELIAAALIVTVYSYFVWKADPDRRVQDESIIRIGNAEVPPSLSINRMTIISIALMVAIAVGFVFFFPQKHRMPAPVPQAKTGVSAEFVARAKELVELSSKGDFVGAEKHFDDVMKGALPPDKLKSTWEAVVDQAGPFEKIAGTRIGQIWPYDIVFVNAKFARESADFKVVFKANGQISGLWVLPAGDR
jgi:uncharacterized membrane protein